MQKRKKKKSLQHHSFAFIHYVSFNPFPNKPWFSRVCSTSLLKTLWEKEKLLIRSNSSFSQSVFYPFWRTFCHFHQTQNCHLQTLSVWDSLKFVAWERVEYLYTAQTLIGITYIFLYGFI